MNEWEDIVDVEVIWNDIWNYISNPLEMSKKLEGI